MLIKVLGPGCAKCKEVEKVINVVVQESGSSAKVEKVTDFIPRQGKSRIP